MRPLAAALAVLAITPLGCRPGPHVPTVPTHVVDERGRRALAEPVTLPTTLDALLDGRLRLVGASVPARAKPGERLSLTLAFLVERELDAAQRPRVFVHAAAPGAELQQAQADHEPVGGKVPPSEWRVGDLVVDGFVLAIPAAIAVDELVVHVGVYQGKDRWPVTPRAAHDGDERVEVGRIHIEGAPPLARKLDVPRRQGPIVVDGLVDEPAWAAAASLAPFLPTDGRSPITRATAARMLWDEEALWLAFDVEDPDVFTVYNERDDPLYESEATELFIDADGDGDVYVELQSAADDVHFDAAFAGGRRQHMDKAWDAPFVTKTVRTARGFTSEWRVPVAALRDIPAGEPRAGASWRINLFRLERIRATAMGSATPPASPPNRKVTRTEASAWSPPLSGDFHHLARFGTITFVDGAR